MNVKKRWSWKNYLCALLAVMIVAVNGGTVSTIEAAALPTAANGTYFSVSGQRMIWLEPDSNGLKKLMYWDEATGLQREIASSAAAKDAPYISGDWIVWADKGGEDPSSLNWDIYGYNVVTSVQKKLNSSTGMYSNPSVDNHGAVWFERKQYGNMIYSDLATGTQLSLGEGRFPILANGIVVYKNARDGGLSMLELSSGVRRSLISLGGANYVDWFVFNGTHALVKQRNGAGESKYVLVAVTNTAAAPQDLTELSKKDVEHTVMVIGDSEAAFLEQVNGVITVKGVQLATASVYPIRTPIATSHMLGFQGSRLLYSDATGTIHILEPNGASDGGNGPGNGPENGSGTGPGAGAGMDAGVEAEESYSTIVTAEGGQLQSADSRMKADFSADTFHSPTKVTLTKTDIAGLALRDEFGRPLKVASDAWLLEAEAAFGKLAELTLYYKDGPAWQENREKLGLYAWNEKQDSWVYIGGISGKIGGAIQAQTAEQGLYAVMLRDVAFTDMAGHWSKHAVDVLAARGILNGMKPELYEPQRTLTRAEFTKMLVGALNMEPIAAAKPTFADVQTKDWHYSWIETAAAAGIVQGYGDMFKPNEALTREQMMTMLMRAVGDRLAQDGQVSADTVLNRFADGPMVSQWAKQSVAEAVSLQLVEGNEGKLLPGSSSTRAQAATVIYRLLGALELL